jgi:hypothetical protein
MTAVADSTVADDEARIARLEAEVAEARRQVSVLVAEVAALTSALRSTLPGRPASA